MNILFIEDEHELREAGVAQLEQHYTVYPVSNIEDARVIMKNPSMPVHLVVADHRLPDGHGIEFVIEMKAQFPDCMYTVVSGCLTDSNISNLEKNEIPYYRKPLLYANVVEDFRRAHLMKTPCREVAVEEPVAPCDTVVETEAPCAETEAPCAETEAPVAETEAPKRKKLFGLF